MALSLRIFSLLVAGSAAAIACSNDLEPITPVDDADDSAEVAGSSGSEPGPGSSSSGAAATSDCALDLTIGGAIEAQLTARACATQGFATTTEGLVVRFVRDASPLPAVGDEIVLTHVQIQDDRAEAREVYETPEGACTFVVDGIGSGNRIATVLQGHGGCTEPAARQLRNDESAADAGTPETITLGDFTFATAFFTE